MKITTVGVCIICGIFPLLILPQLPGTLTLAFLTLFACVLAFIRKANFVGRRNLNWRDAGCNC